MANQSMFRNLLNNKHYFTSAYGFREVKKIWIKKFISPFLYPLEGKPDLCIHRAV
jgi:hypothetical protein